MSAMRANTLVCLELLESRLVLSAYPGVPDDLLTANGYYILDGNGYRITGIQQLVDAYAPVMKFDGGNIHTEAVAQIGLPFTPTQLHGIINELEHQAEIYHPKEVEIVTGHLDSDPLADPNVERNGQTLSTLMDIGDLGAFYRPENARTGSAGDMDTYIDLPGGVISEINANYGELKDRYQDAIYATVAMDAATGVLSVQYWFFYYGNDFWDTHEGDWEGAMVLFDKVGPYQAHYFQHDSGEDRSWSNVEKATLPWQNEPTHPVVYVSANSHASYFEPGRRLINFMWDYEYGDGDVLRPGYEMDVRVMPRVEPDDFSVSLDNIAGHDMNWLRFQGKWGQPALGGNILPTDGPRGPGMARDKFAKPFQYAQTPPVRPPADLNGQVMSTMTPSPGSSLDLSYAVRNSGGWPATNFKVGFYVSDNNVITTAGADIPLATRTIDVLGPDEYRTGDLTLALPAFPSCFTPDNEYWIGMASDPTGVVAESNEANNANLGAGLDMVSIQAERNLHSPADGTVVAQPLGVNDYGVLTFAGGIGDEWIGARDIDVYSKDVVAGQTWGFDLDRTSGTVDLYLRVYDAAWSLLASNDNAAMPGEAASTDAFLTRAFTQSGTVYVVVSSKENAAADPRQLSGRVAGGMGDYTLAVFPGTTELRGAGLTVVPAAVGADGHLHVNYAIENAGYAASGAFNANFYVKDGGNLDPLADTPAAVVPIANVPGVSTLTGSVAITLPAPDPYRTDNEYVVYMWVNPPVTVSPVTYAVQEYDTNNDFGRGLGLDTATFSSERHLGKVWSTGQLLAETVALDATTSGDIGGDEWIGARDMDVYKFTVQAGQTVALDLDRTGGTLDAYIRLYEIEPGGSALTLLAANDNAASPGDTVFNGVDSYLAYTFTQAGDYYVVVSSAPNAAADPSTLAGRSVGSTGTYTLDVTQLRPDVVVSNFRVPAQEMRWGRQSAWTTLSLVNNGVGAAGGFDIAIYLSDAPGSPPAGATPIWRESVLPAELPHGCLLPGDTYDIMPHPFLPEPDPFRTDNQYWLTVVLDPDHALNDANVANNTVTAPTPLLSEKDLPSPAGTTWSATAMTVGSTVRACIGIDEWTGPYDLDVWSFTVAGPGPLGIDLDRVAGDLDSFIRLYDSTGKLLASNDNAAAPGEAASTDSYLLRNFTSAGTYYVVVGSATNRSANPNVLTGRAAGTTGQYDLTIAPPQPDLYGTGFAATAVTPVGTTTLTYSLRNGGIAAATGVTVRFYLSDDNVFNVSGSGDWLLQTVNLGTVASGQSISGTLAVQVPYPDLMRTDNQYWLGMVIESAADVDPSNNLNRGAALDMAAVSSEAHLPSPASGSSVVAETIQFETPIGGDIGGDEWIGGYDIDTYSFHANAGQGFGLDVDRIAGTLDSYLRLYDSSWNLLDANDDGEAPEDAAGGGDSFLMFTAGASGTYYAVVSDAANAGADPRSLAGRTAGATGTYWLTLAPEMADLVGENFAIDPATPLAYGGRTSVNITIANRGLRAADAPFEVVIYLSEDGVIDPAEDQLAGTATISAGIAPGATWTGNVEVAFFSADKFLTDNQYYLGMVIDARENIEEWSEDNNFNVGLNKDLCAFRSEDSLPSPVDGTVDSPLLSGETYLAAAIGDEWVGGRDIDTFAFVAPVAQKFGFDLDRTSGTLNPWLRLYDAAWNLVAQNDNGQALGEAASSDSYLEYSFTAGGQYYVVASDAANAAADPRVLSGRTNGTMGDYTLQILQIAPDLSAAGAAPAGPLTWGQTIQLDSTILNEGYLASLPVQVRFYLSADAVISESDYCLGSRGIGELLAGASDALTSPLVLPNMPPTGFTADDTVYVGMLIDPQGNAVDSDRTNNTWASAATAIGAPAFPFDAKHAYTLTDADGDLVTVKLAGPGSGTVVLVQPQPSDIAAIRLTGTTAASSLTITVKKAGAGLGQTTIGGITVNGDLKNLSGPKADLGGDVFIDGTATRVVLDDTVGEHTFRIGPSAKAGGTVTLQFDEPNDLTIDSLTGIKKLTAARYLNTGGAADRVEAPWLENLTVAGKRNVFAGDMSVGLQMTGLGLPAKKTALGKVIVKGAVAGGQWNIFGTTTSIAVGSSQSAWTAWFGGPVMKLRSTGDLGGDLSAPSFVDTQVSGSMVGTHLRGTNWPDATLPAIGKLVVKGWIDHAHIETNGNVAAVTAGGMRYSNVYVGTESSFGFDSNGDGVWDLFDPNMSYYFPTGRRSRLASLTVKGLKGETYSYINSNLAAWNLGTISLVNALSDNAANTHAPFGLTCETLQAFRYQDATHTIVWPTTPASHLGWTLFDDFQARVHTQP